MKRVLIGVAALLILAAAFAALRVWPIIRGAQALMACTDAKTPAEGVDACTRALALAAEGRWGQKSKNSAVIASVMRAQYRLLLRRDDPQALTDLDEAKRLVMEKDYGLDADPDVKRATNAAMAETFAMRWTLLAGQGRFPEALAETQDAQLRSGASEEWRARAACSVPAGAPACRELMNRAPVPLKIY